jgi:uncharacterized ferritin-like protein (DUF455 family)
MKVPNFSVDSAPVLSAPNSSPAINPAELRQLALQWFVHDDPVTKAQSLMQTPAGLEVDAQREFYSPSPQPGRRALPLLVPHTQIKPAKLNTPEGHAALVHSVVHIERNAIDLALDVVWRFSGMPEDFYRAWFQVAQEEALHFSLLSEHLQTLGFSYGHFPAHDGLWEMAERTQNDLLARVALVPRTLEARGLDASPAVKNKLLSVGDLRGAEILDLILRDEVGHVALGNRWYGHLCQQRGLEPVATFAQLRQQYQAPRMKGPFNLPARRAAGFSESELQALLTMAQD